jgi:integrase
MGLYKRGQVWWMDFIYKGKRFRRSTETTDRRMARRIFDKVKGEVAEGKWFERLPGEDKLFTDLMDKYLAEHASLTASARSFRGYAKRLSSFFGNHTILEITPSLINEYKIQRRNDGVKPATTNRELATMKKAFNLALKEWQWVKDNPVSKVSMEKEDNKRDRWLMRDEEGRLLGACEFWLMELVVFALNTGMRLSEILGLTWKGVDLFRKTLTVFKSKNGEKRTIPMNATVFEMLKDKAKVRSIRTDLVFPSQAFTIIDKCNVGKAFRLAREKAKVEDFRFHDLRHTFATRLVQAGKDLYQVQCLLGHKSPSMTQRYAHHYPESLRDAVEVLDRHEDLCHKKDTINEKGVNPFGLTT